MAHFAELDENNIVLRVLVVDNKDTSDENGIENESIGVAFLQKLFGAETRWVQTSFNNKFRKVFAHIGGTYDLNEDAFIPAAVDKWHIFNKETWMWEPPIPEPTTEGVHTWNSVTGQWETKIITPTPALEG